MASKRSLNVGVVGLGNMGVPIARNLGFKARSAMYLQLHSRSLSKARKVCDDMSVDGVTCAMRVHDRYSTMTRWCDIVLLTLANNEAAERVLLRDEEALLPNARAGQLIVDHTTVDVALSRECARVASRRGAVFLDAPMSGSPRAAFNGQLVLMVGGNKEAFQRLLPLFRMYADAIHHMGDSGSGTATKLLSQALVASHNAAAAEAMTLANRLGIEDCTRLVNVLDASWASSTMLRRNAPTMQDLLRSPDTVPPTSGSSVQSLLDDLALLDASLLRARAGGHAGGRVHAATATSAHSDADAHNDDVDEPYPVLDSSLRMLAAAADAGAGEQDMSAVVHYIQAAAIHAPEAAATTREVSSMTSARTSHARVHDTAQGTATASSLATLSSAAAAVSAGGVVAGLQTASSVDEAVVLPDASDAPMSATAHAHEQCRQHGNNNNTADSDSADTIHSGTTDGNGGARAAATDAVTFTAEDFY